ncbi:HypC/HybG/HupF family hydrogenase formation chaperone [Thermobrachium celere]|uniref:[NiFe] hydrogenase metallocenter assembly protein HypC n=1 Tax=Thermobrachium celere DSM 8682 TaxID=941824 RepID=R7RS94_9CLOT|nr:HypC/HybG/HupF family hydrogenase formation chaperone [Thermobrachium celere]GFR34321.1 hydrogenase [Thermobrachium celere]CDF58158.1 [NiFe] hydrogenase metallocenter assembly protein HypC [Thermobrachium celere DSM 8682]
MCLAVPLKVVNIEGNTAQAEIEGVKRTIRIDFVKDVKVGDYVIVHAGFAIEKLKEEDAIENLRLIKEVTDALK